jgi:OPT family oligopeptide transporter
MNEDKLYTPQANEAQLTVRAVIAGCLIGGVVAAMNIYFGLRTGWGIGGSIIAAILSYSLFQILNPKQEFSILETNIAQTAGSAAGSMSSAAGLVSAIPAMSMLGYKLSMMELFAWALSIAYLGVFFAIPLRKQMVVVEKLRFPTGTATAETIVAVFAKGEEAMRKSKALLWMAAIAGLHTLIAYFWSGFSMPGVIKMIGLGAIAAWGFKILISPMMFGAGILIGPRVGISLFIGAVLSWGVLGPWATEMGWVSDKIMDYKTGARGWILWPGVALMVTDALMALVLSYKSIINTFKKVDTSSIEEDSSQKIPTKWIYIGLGTASLLTIIFAQKLFDIHPLLTIAAICISAILSLIATRSTGETDINPIGGMGKVTQMIYGVISPGSMSTNLMAAAITGSGASQAADMMQDLKTGHMLGANPFKQFKAQLVGITVGIFFAIPIYKLFDSAYTIGEGNIPAPAAHAWKAMAQVLSQGAESMPQNSMYAVFGAIIFGIVLSLLKKVEKIKAYLPSGLAMGIAFIVPAYYSVAMFIGAMFLVWWRKSKPTTCEALGFAVASGLVAGEGLMGIVTAVLTLLGIGA